MLPWRLLRTIRSALSSPPREARLDHNRRDPGRRVQRSRQARSAGQRTGPTHLHGPSEANNLSDDKTSGAYRLPRIALRPQRYSLPGPALQLAEEQESITRRWEQK